MQTQTISSWKKPLRFALFGALGCLAGALCGELWLAITRPAPPPPPPPAPPRPAQTIVLVLDTSGSMFGHMGEMKQAAQNFVSKQDFSKDRTAVVHFDTDAEVVAPLTQNAALLQNALGGLSLGGSTRMDLGLQLASLQLQETLGNRSVLLFTDGQPDDANSPSPLSIQEAQSLRSKGVRIVAIATGSADTDFLARVTGDPALVVPTTSREYSQAFDRAQSTIYGRQLTDSAPVNATDLGSALRRIAVWTALLSAGLAFALLWGQAGYLHRPLGSSDWLALGSSVAFGFLAGVVAQLLFGAIGGGGELGRLISWALLGALIAQGMGRAIPNLDRNKSLRFGAVGGALASLGFAQFASLGSDISGRLMGATLLGGVIGLLVIFVERASRQFWLEVGGKDGNAEVRYDLNLGKEAVRLGSNREMCRIYLPQSAATVGEFWIEGEQVFYREQGKAQEHIAAGRTLAFDNLNVTLRQSLKEVPAVSTTPAPTLPIVSPTTSPASLPVSPPSPTTTTTMANSLPAPTLANPSASMRGWCLVSAGQKLPLPLQDGVYSLGRVPSNDLVIGDDAVSSHHGQIEVRDGRIWFSDLGSTNGSWVNDTRLAQAPVELHEGDSIKIGRREWLLARSSQP